MSDFRTKLFDETEMDTVIAEDVVFEGEMAFEQPLVVKGRLKGALRAKGDLHIEEGAEVDARVEGRRAWIKGRLKGDFSADSRLELFSTSVLDGNVKTPDLVMQSGCRFNGRCEMPPPPDKTQGDKEHER